MRNTNERGMALIATILLLALVGALIVGFVEVISSDQRSGRAGGDQTQAYAAAHAGLEKLTSDLGQVFSANYAPTCNDIDALFAAGRQPSLPGITFAAPGGGTGYRIEYNCVNGAPKAEEQPRDISSGPYQGFKGLITPYWVTVTARTGSGAEVRMRRELQTVAIPVFQFGMFSENDLSFFAGPNFNFGGRVHTNSNLFLAEGSGNTLTLADRVTVWGEVIRRNLANGFLTEGNYDGTVRVARSSSQTTTMGFGQGSWNAALPQLPGTPTGEALLPKNDAWDAFSVSATNYYMRNARTGARRLDLPLAQMGAQPIDLIRRPVASSNENVANAAVFGQRYFAMASLRILLSDNAADIADLPTVTADPPVALTRAGLLAAGYVEGPDTPPLALAPAANPANDNYMTAANADLIGGFIKIEVQLPDRSWQDVTLEILNRGLAGRNLSAADASPLNKVGGSPCTEPNPNAIVRLQRLRDNPAAGGCGNGSVLPTDYWPNALYDAREGAFRDFSGQQTERRHFLGGIVHYVELDIGQLKTWLEARGANVMQETGYVVYFSDRRGNWHDPAAANRETGEYGFEDVVNPASANGTVNGLYAADAAAATLDSGSTPDAGEDVNADGQLQTYGALPSPALGGVLGSGARPWDLINWNYAGGSVFLLGKPMVARVNPPIFFRRALKLVNGARPNIILPGLTVAAENPVYVQGNYNADAGGYGGVNDVHGACAVIGDAVTLLSNQWNDINSFLSPHDPPGGHPGAGPTSPGRNATGNAWYRMAVIAGKGLSFPRPTGYATYQDFGTDGGAHNFLRYLENWGSTLNYRGSIVSFYTSRQAVGTYKCCQNVYSPPTRGYNFDTDFLTPSLLPPRTPMFRDVNTLQFRQILRATQ